MTGSSDSRTSPWLVCGLVVLANWASTAGLYNAAQGSEGSSASERQSIADVQRETQDIRKGAAGERRGKKALKSVRHSGEADPASRQPKDADQENPSDADEEEGPKLGAPPGPDWDRLERGSSPEQRSTQRCPGSICRVQSLQQARLPFLRERLPFTPYTNLRGALLRHLIQPQAPPA